MVKSVDTRDLKSLARKGVPVQVRPRAPLTDLHSRSHWFNKIVYAGIAQLVERYLAKVEVTSSSLVARSKMALLRLCSDFNKHVNKQDAA